MLFCFCNREEKKQKKKEEKAREKAEEKEERERKEEVDKLRREEEARLAYERLAQESQGMKKIFLVFCSTLPPYLVSFSLGVSISIPL